MDVFLSILVVKLLAWQGWFSAQYPAGINNIIESVQISIAISTTKAQEHTSAVKINFSLIPLPAATYERD